MEDAVIVMKVKANITRLKDGQILPMDKDDTSTPDRELVQGYGVYSSNPESENAKWSKATPSLNLSATIDNPTAVGRLKAGKEYLIYWVEVPDGK